MYEEIEYAVTSAERRGASQAEAFSTESRSLNAVIEKGEVKSVDSKLDTGIGLRVLIKKLGGVFLGSSYTMDMRESAIETMADGAISIALTKPEQKEIRSFHDSRKVQKVDSLFDRRISSLEATEACSLANDMIESARLRESIVSMSGSLLFVSYNTALKNSLGIETGYSATTFKASYYVTAKNENSVGSAGDDYSNRILDEEKAIEVARHSASMAISQLDPKSVKAGVMDVVVGPDAVASILENTFALMISADQVQRKQSPYRGRIDSEVASDAITVVAEGRYPGWIGSKPYDDEGYPTQTTTVVEKGVLRSFLHNTSSAAKENRESTGNALRPSSADTASKYLGEPVVHHTNLKIGEGTETFESILSSVKDGIYVRHVIGAHTANRITGEFSVAPLVAYKIEKGQIIHPVREAMIGCNIQDFLKNVTDVGVHWKQCEGAYFDTAIVSPILKIEKVSVSA